MNKSNSVHNLQASYRNSDLSKSPSRRAIYLNQQTSKTNVNTHFHSPYKDGKRNKEYVNPSFVSSNLFYPQNFIEDTNKFVVRPNIIPTPTDEKRYQLYQQRMENQKMERLGIKSQKQSRSNRNQNIHRISETNRIQHQKLMKNQLSRIRNYHKKSEKEDKQNYQKSNPQILQVPSYLQKHHATNTYEQTEQSTKKRILQQFMKLNNILLDEKRQNKKSQAHKQHQLVNRIIENNNRYNLIEYWNSKKQSNLLGDILREQIRINQKDRV